MMFMSFLARQFGNNGSGRGAEGKTEHGALKAVGDLSHAEGYEGLPPEVRENVDAIVASVVGRVKTLKDMPMLGKMLRERLGHFQEQVEERSLENYIGVLLTEVYMRVKEELKRGTKDGS